MRKSRQLPFSHYQRHTHDVFSNNQNARANNTGLLDCFGAVMKISSRLLPYPNKLATTQIFISLLH